MINASSTRFPHIALALLNGGSQMKSHPSSRESWLACPVCQHRFVPTFAHVGQQAMTVCPHCFSVIAAHEAKTRARGPEVMREY
jgi:hypothetical protein